MDFYYYRIVVYRHCQNTFQYNQLEVHVPLYDYMILYKFYYKEVE